MKKIAFFGSIAAALLMSACANQGTTTATTQKQHTHTAPIASPAATSTLPDQVFHCRDGRTATVKFNAGEDQIRLYVDTIESSAILALAQSASGERYVNANGFYNQPTEFHFKGKEGHLTFFDVNKSKVQTTCKSK